MRLLVVIIVFDAVRADLHSERSMLYVHGDDVALKPLRSALEQCLDAVADLKLLDFRGLPRHPRPLRDRGLRRRRHARGIVVVALQRCAARVLALVGVALGLRAVRSTSLREGEAALEVLD